MVLVLQLRAERNKITAQTALVEAESEKDDKAANNVIFNRLLDMMAQSIARIATTQDTQVTLLARMEGNQTSNATVITKVATDLGLHSPDGTPLPELTIGALIRLHLPLIAEDVKKTLILLETLNHAAVVTQTNGKHHTDLSTIEGFTT